MKELHFKQEARTKLLAGVEKLNNAVSVTLGPKGRNVIIEQDYADPHITKDGITVANSIILKDKVEELAVKIIRQAASNTAKEAGDGTTTATVLASEIYRNALLEVEKGNNPILLKKGMDYACSIILNELEQYSKKVKGDKNILKSVATMSANNDESIGNLVAEVSSKVGAKGIIQLEEGAKDFDYYEMVEGYTFDKGYVTPYFINNESRNNCVLENCYILMTDRKINNIKSIMPLLEKMAGNTDKSLLIIASDYEGSILSNLVVNTKKGVIKVCAVKAPSTGDRRKEILNDISIVCGGEAILQSLDMNVEKKCISALGFAKKVVIDSDSTTIINTDDKKEAIKTRLKDLSLELSKAEADYTRDKIKERMAKLSGKIAVYYVGAKTEAELKERKDRVEDSIYATRAALEEGVVIGGGNTLVHISGTIFGADYGLSKEIELGFNIVAEAIIKPFATILRNAGIEEYSQIVDDLFNSGADMGYSVVDNKIINMSEFNIYDPKKVTRLALSNAVSAASMLITTEAVIVEHEDSPKQKDETVL